LLGADNVARYLSKRKLDEEQCDNGSKFEYGPGPRALAEVGSRNVLEFVSQAVEHSEANPMMMKEIEELESRENGAE
jgi:hypothetical protein